MVPHRYTIQTKKDRIKLIRTILEYIVIALVTVLVLRALLVTKKYQPYQTQKNMETDTDDPGFIALSYFGVDRDGTDTLISLRRLTEELTVLKKLGYVTVTQKDLEDYYYEGKKLPEKSLFLMFEDGRKDTVLFTEKLLEKLNYKASILTYAEKFERNDQKFVSPEDLKKLEKEGFWELGTNGYRLSYINVFDRYNRFIGQMDSREFVEVNQYIDRNYNHYLMDYIRDKHGIPTESTAEMSDRITRDYDLMEQIYTKRLGKLPDLYCIMHSNTSRYGDNANVSDANAENLEGMFLLNVNREGYSYNNRKSSVFDLTRLEPQAWWYTNHLLMRIRDDLPEKEKNGIRFVRGNEKEYRKWSLEKGAVEFRKDVIALTSQSKSTGIVSLKDTLVKNLHLTCELEGNKIGGQFICLRTKGNAEKGFQNALTVSVENNVLYVRETVSEREQTLLKKDLFELHDTNPVSVEEDSQKALVAELKVRGKFATDNTIAGLYGLKAFQESKKHVRSVADGAEEYIPEIQISDPGHVKIDLTLSGSSLRLLVDGIVVADNLRIHDLPAGGITLKSAFGGFGKSQRNIADDVFDAAFRHLKITSADGKKTYFDNSLHGWSAFTEASSEFWNHVVDWFIENL
ncbi:glycoside hydrolase [Porcincola sp. LCP21S3_C12]|uniref:glycoside hydrolase n=1 Tax=Porcincola sp. LCP21S3_C12 TaxID=3438798 RepID=UPI003F9AAC89